MEIFFFFAKKLFLTCHGIWQHNHPFPTSYYVRCFWNCLDPLLFRGFYKNVGTFIFIAIRWFFCLVCKYFDCFIVNYIPFLCVNIFLFSYSVFVLRKNGLIFCCPRVMTLGVWCQIISFDYSFFVMFGRNLYNCVDLLVNFICNFFDLNSKLAFLLLLPGPFLLTHHM